MRYYSLRGFLHSPYAAHLSDQEKLELQAVAKVFPFKVSQYVLENLVDWANHREDPIYRLTFPHREMLTRADWALLTGAIGSSGERDAVLQIRKRLNPHPDGQKRYVPTFNGAGIAGVQHKYRETVLFFPGEGQTCHSYCTYCFRWAQFVNVGYRFASKEVANLVSYLAEHIEVTDLLLTGGDPLWMDNAHLARYLTALVRPELDHVRNIRVGTKALAYDPGRFLGDDGEGLIRILTSLLEAGKNIALMAHFTHPRELETGYVHAAVEKLRSAGVVIRTQAPVVRHINDNPTVWADMWRKQVYLGMVPYYMFVERDTGAQHYFSVPIADAARIFREAFSCVSGLVKTVRGPVMSTEIGKVHVLGAIRTEGKRKFVLSFIQCIDPGLVNVPFLADYDPNATWFDQLVVEREFGASLAELSPQEQSNWDVAQ